MMISKISFPSNFILPSSDLPLTLISLEEWVLITLNGKDTLNYLQGQLTCDVFSLNKKHHCFAANCNIKGKMISNISLFYFRNGMAFIERRSIINSHLSYLKKYTIFSNITITVDDSLILIGVAGLKARSTLSNILEQLPDETNTIVHDKNITCLYFSLPTERFILIITESMFNNLFYLLKDKVELNNSKQWVALDIEAGFPVIDNITSSKFTPQSTNIHLLKGISYNKGCYIGQEMIAKEKYLGINNRSLYWLEGQGKIIPVSGTNLEYANFKHNHNWRKTGTVLIACQLKDKKIWIQAVLNNNLYKNFKFRIMEDNTSILIFRSLPYL